VLPAIATATPTTHTSLFNMFALCPASDIHTVITAHSSACPNATFSAAHVHCVYPAAAIRVAGVSPFGSLWNSCPAAAMAFECCCADCIKQLSSASGGSWLCCRSVLMRQSILFGSNERATGKEPSMDKQASATESERCMMIQKRIRGKYTVQSAAYCGEKAGFD